MRNPFRRKTPRDMYLSMRERLHSELSDRDSELRQLFARVARSEAKNFFALHYGTEVEKFERELAARAARVLAELGSAAPSLEQYAADAVALTMPDVAAIATGALAVKAYHDQHAADAVALLRTCNGCAGPKSSLPGDPGLNPDCPAHGDPAVLAQLKENQ